MTTTIKNLKQHAMYTPSDLAYFLKKGYTNEAILEFWDRDLALCKKPLDHKPAPRIVEYLNE